MGHITHVGERQNAYKILVSLHRREHLGHLGVDKGNKMNVDVTLKIVCGC